MATKKAAKPVEQYRVLRSFREGGTMFTSDARGQVSGLPAGVIKSRLERGYIAELRPSTATDDAPDKAKE